MIWLLAFLTINSKTEFRTGRNQKCQRISDNDQTDRAAWLRSLVMLTTVRLLVTTTVPTPARTSYHHHGKPTRHKPEQYTNYSIINYCYTCFLYHSYTILFLYEFFTILCPPCSRAPLWWGLDILPAMIIVVNQEAPSHLWCVSQSSGHHDITRHPVLQSPPTQSNEMLELNTAQCRPQQIYLRLRWELLQFVWLFTEIKNMSCWDYFVITALKITYIFIHLLR